MNVPSSQQLVSGKWFSDSRITMDGFYFKNCVFENCILEALSPDFTIDNCEVRPSNEWHLGGSLSDALGLLGYLYRNGLKQKILEILEEAPRFTQAVTPEKKTEVPAICSNPKCRALGRSGMFVGPGSIYNLFIGNAAGECPRCGSAMLVIDGACSNYGYEFEILPASLKDARLLSEAIAAFQKVDLTTMGAKQAVEILRKEAPGWRQIWDAIAENTPETIKLIKALKEFALSLAVLIHGPSAAETVKAVIVEVPAAVVQIVDALRREAPSGSQNPPTPLPPKPKTSPTRGPIE